MLGKVSILAKLPFLQPQNKKKTFTFQIDYEKWTCLKLSGQWLANSRFSKRNSLFHISFYTSQEKYYLCGSNIIILSIYILFIHSINSKLQTQFFWRTLTNTDFIRYDRCFIRWGNLDTDVHRGKMTWRHRERQPPISQGKKLKDTKPADNLISDF